MQVKPADFFSHPPAPKRLKTETTTEFQICSWYSNGDDRCIDSSFYPVMVGRTLGGEPIKVAVEGFRLRLLIEDLGDAPVCEERHEMILGFLRSRAWMMNPLHDDDHTTPRYLNLSSRVQMGGIVNRKSLWGYQAEAGPMYEFVFDGAALYSKVMRLFKYPESQGDKPSYSISHSNLPPITLADLKLYDYIDPFLAVAHDLGIAMSGWVMAELNSTMRDQDGVYHVQHEAILRGSCESMAPFTEMSFDIEVFPSENIFPKPEVLGNVVFQIGTSFRDRHGTENVMFHLGSCSMEPQVRTDDHFTVICYNTEKELLQAFFKYIQRKDPDFIYSYNGDKFDWSYVVTRCIQHYGIHPQISRKPGHIASVREAKFSNAALGDNEYKIVDIPGRCSIDVLVVVQRGMEQFSDYKLETVAQSILGKGKDDIDVGDMIRAFRSRDPKQLRTVAEYCMQDTYLVQELVDRMDVLTQLTEMSNITYVPITYLLQRGQQIKVYSQIARKAKMSGFAVPTVTPDRDPTVSFTGATVLEPTVGAYYTPVAVLDFASLYPTIMMAYNVCYTTIVLPDVGVPRGKTVDEIRWTEPDGTEKSYEYVQDTESVVPALQRELFASRKRVKAMIRETNDPLRKRILKGRELAIKVSMNSIYGFTSANMLYMQCLSASVTAVGRRMINQTKHFMENEFGPGIYLNDLNLKVIGGDTDSVFIHFPNSTIEVAMHLANIAANQLTTTIFNRAPIKMEYEKVYCPYVLQAKKNYVGRMYTNDPDKPDKIDFKGIAVKRRNYCPLLKTVFWNIIQEVMDKERTVGARGGIELLKTTLKRLEDNTVPLGELAITNKLAKEYSGNAKIPHVELAKRMQQRDPGSAPVPGERFAYVFVDRPGTKDTHERAESLDFAVKHNMRPDLLYYIDHIRKPLDTFYKVLGFERELNSVLKEVENRIKNRNNNQMGIHGFFKPSGQRGAFITGVDAVAVAAEAASVPIKAKAKAKPKPKAKK